jgi:hypothetical protein
MKDHLRTVRQKVVQLRCALEPAFSKETAVPGTTGHIPSAGHCAVVAELVRRRMGGRLVSATVENESHWFNRLPMGEEFVDVDLTGDQFGRAPVQIASRGCLYSGTRVRRHAELLPETLARSLALEGRLRDSRKSVERLSQHSRPKPRTRKASSVSAAGSARIVSKRPELSGATGNPCHRSTR